MTLASTYGGADVGNYTITGQATTTADITPAALAVSGITASDKVYDATTDATVDTSGAAFAGLLGSDSVTVSATGSFADKHVGTGKSVTLASTYGGADVGNYTITGQATTTADITPAALAVSGITASDKVYDATTDATVDTSGAAFAGLLASDSVTVSATGSFADKNVGTGKTVTLASTYGGADAGNYTITGQATATADITTASLAVSGITAGNKVYDATTDATVDTSGAAFAGLLGSDSVTVSATGSFADKHVGTGKSVTLASTYGGADVGNYTITDQATTTADITPAALTVSGITASNKIYDATVTAAVNTDGAIYTGLLASDSVTVSATGSFADKNVGSGKTVTLASIYGGADAGNYTISDQASTTADITPAALTVSGITAADKVYDGTTDATTDTSAAVYIGLLAGDSITVSATGSFADKNVGTGKSVTLASTYGGADAGNYTISDQATATADITPAALTVSGITAGDKVYDGTTTATVATGAAVYTGLVDGDAVTVGATGAFSDKNVGADKAVTLTSTYSGADVGNYTITDQAGTTADITPKDVTLTASSVTKTYDGGTTYLTTAGDLNALSASLVGGDTVSAATITYADKNAGSGNKTVTLDAVTIDDGNDGNNYRVTLAGNGTGTIGPRAVTLTAASVTKTYDGGTTYDTTAGDLDTLSASLVDGDSVIAATIRYADKKLGTGNKRVSLDSATIDDGNGGKNYSVSLAGNSTSTILPAETRSVNGPAVSTMQLGYRVPDSGPSVQLDPMQWYHIINGPAKPTTVLLQVQNGGVNATDHSPASTCNGKTGFDSFAVPDEEIGLCGR